VNAALKLVSVPPGPYPTLTGGPEASHGAMQRPQTDDANLVSRTLDGDQLAFQELVERHSDRLFSLVRHYTRSAAEIEDVVQETFLKAFSKLETFQLQSSFSTWIHRIAVNTALDMLKRRGRNPVTAVEDPELAAPAGSRNLPAPDAAMARDEIAEVTHRVLEELPEIFRTVLVLREFEDQSYLEIAEVLDISIGTVESRLFRARARFKDALLRLFPEYGEAPEENVS